ncbi:YlbE-like family protein [Evansella sp. AB-P1]|uniref:YlbE-like family protein n=1 Tax=Evansella sp. AB-P1 TaxID=3037653 RepID=UPI00241C4A9F|nr:YlbE-like family protein [Evansella sp. AB-P1]MDG5788318.1 YlbE-like family protein [Evansella sp. AB-P1]
MRTEVYNYVRSQPDLHRFLRYNPMWYRKLSRNPFSLKEMEKEAKIFHGKTFPQRMDRLQNSMNMAVMMLEMMKQFNNKG